MRFMIEFSIKSGNKNKAVQAFEQRGPNRSPGVTFHGAWIGKDSDKAFVLVDAADESLVTGAVRSWSELGDYRITPVIDVEQY